MTSSSGPGAQPPARRDNGLRADQFVALADVDPRLGEHLLDLLRLAEIPAYLEPSTDPRVAVRYRSAGPVERLYVHADQRQEARAVVVAAAREAGESAEPLDPPKPPASARRDVLAGIDTDAEFARIVSGFSSPGPSAPAPRGAPVSPGPSGFVDPARPADPVVSPDPAVEDPSVAADPGVAADSGPSADPGASADRRATDSAPVNRHGIDPADLVRDPDTGEGGAPVTPADLDAAAEAAAKARAALDDDLDDDVEDEDDHFHPPTAPPFPVPTANTVAAVLLLVLGVLVLLRGDVFGLDSTGSFPASIILMLVASVLLIRGLRDQPDPGEEPEDDGAEV